ncbi:MAG: hypothetical protein MK161_16900 [Pirellulales bacterium]|nr:hypothetical protein [Pirellulales bacterium]
MFFGVGNGTVSGNLAIQGFQFTDSSFAAPKAQFGISQGWVQINHDLGFENVQMEAKVGSAWHRYGMAGVYDAGEYDTYLFGRTHLMGGDVRFDIDLNSFVLGVEGGFGVHKPDSEMYNRARFTPAAHGHLFAEFDGIDVSAHALHAWASADVVGGVDVLDRDGNPNPTDSVYAAPLYPSAGPGSNCGYNDGAGNTDNGTPPGIQCVTDFEGFAGGPAGNQGAFGPEYPTGKQTIVGADVRFDFGLLGTLYAGYSHQFLSNALTVSNAIESIHSLGAGEFKLGVVDNYLESTFCPVDSAPNESCSNGDGNVGTILAQYELGLANFGMLPGDMDLRMKLYGMANFVSVKGDAVVDANGNVIYSGEDAYLAEIADANGDGTVTGEEMDAVKQDGVKKIKFGLDTEFFPLDWLSAGLRFDHLRPNSKVSQQNFSVLSPRITLRTKMVTHETITLQYSRYFYAQRECSVVDGVAGSATEGTTFYSSPADDPYRQGTTNPGPIDASSRKVLNPNTGLPLDAYCVQPPASPSPPDGFGSTASNQPPGNRGAPTLTPDENVIKLEASIWW